VSDLIPRRNSSGIFSQVSVQARGKEEAVILIRGPSWPVLTTAFVAYSDPDFIRQVLSLDL